MAMPSLAAFRTDSNRWFRPSPAPDFVRAVRFRARRCTSAMWLNARARSANSSSLAGDHAGLVIAVLDPLRTAPELPQMQRDRVGQQPPDDHGGDQNQRPCRGHSRAAGSESPCRWMTRMPISQHESQRHEIGQHDPVCDFTTERHRFPLNSKFKKAGTERAYVLSSFLSNAFRIPENPHNRGRPDLQ